MSKTLAVVRDLVTLAGVALVSIGAGQIYLPAGLIVAGALLIAGAALSARRG
jgi:hypothetical protein